MQQQGVPSSKENMPYQSNEIIKVTHGGVEIVYDERYNRWDFTLRGNERHATSLESAKESINKPYRPKEDGPKFDRVKAFTTTYGDVENVDVTSRVGSGNNFRYRVTDKKQNSWRRGGTQTGYGNNIFPSTPENVAKADCMRRLSEKIDELGKERSAIRATLQSLDAYLKEKDAEELAKAESGVDTDTGKE